MFNVAGWCVAIVLALSTLYGEYKAVRKDNPKPFTRTENIIYGTFSRCAWGLALAWVIFACHRGLGGRCRFVSQTWVGCSRNLLNIVSVMETRKGCLEFRSLVDVESSEAPFRTISTAHISTLPYLIYCSNSRLTLIQCRCHLFDCTRRVWNRSWNYLVDFEE